MLCVAKGTAQVAAAEAHEDGRRTAVVAFALKGAEYFVDLIQNETYSYICRFASLRAKRGNPDIKLALLDCFVVPSRKDAKRMKKLVKVLWRVILDVGSLVVARFPHIGTVAVRDSVHNPFGQVLSGGIEVQHIVEVGMVNLPMNQPFDFREVAHHPVAVELLATAIHINLPVVAMQVLALALIVEVKLMAGGYF